MKENKYTDQEIIEGIRTKRSDVLLYIYSQNFKFIKKYILDNSGDETDAEDVFQDTLIVLFNKTRNNSLILTGNFSVFLYTIAKTKWMNVLRQRRKAITSINEYTENAEKDLEIIDELIQAEKEKLVITHFNEISEDCKKIFNCLFDGRTLEEITVLMGYTSVQHTKNRRFMCKKHLIGKIMSNPRFKELTNGKPGKNDQIPRW